MMKKVLLLAISIVLASIVAGCSEKGETNPYKLVTLREATRGMAVSKGFKYRLQNPDIVALDRNLGLIREGNLLEFIGGRSLEDKMMGMTDGFFELQVVKQYSPFVHFKVEKVATETDTVIIPRTGVIPWPQIWFATAYNTEAYERPDIHQIPYNRTGTLRGFVGKKLHVNAHIEEMEEEGKKYFVLVGENARFRVADPTNGIGLMLKVLLENNYEFEGGVVLTTVEDYGPRMKTHTWRGA